MLKPIEDNDMFIDFDDEEVGNDDLDIMSFHNEESNYEENADDDFYEEVSVPKKNHRRIKTLVGMTCAIALGGTAVAGSMMNLHYQQTVLAKSMDDATTSMVQLKVIDIRRVHNKALQKKSKKQDRINEKWKAKEEKKAKEEQAKAAKKKADAEKRAQEEQARKEAEAQAQAQAQAQALQEQQAQQEAQAQAQAEAQAASQTNDTNNSQQQASTQSSSWSGSVLSAAAGVNQGPSGKETYYNLDMSGVISIMRGMGNNDRYWVRDDGVKMLGNYVMVAADLSVHPRGSLVPTSLGTGIVCDTGSFIYSNPNQLDIATSW